MLPRRCRWLLLLLAAVVANAFFVAPPARPPRRQQVLVGSSVSAADVEAKLEGVWDKDVPPSIEAVIAQAQASLGAALGAGERRVRVDIRTPGLDEALEQTAIREKSLLLSVVGAFFPLLATASKAKVLFESEGGAAMAAKAFSGGAWDIPESVTFAGLTSRAVAPDDDVVFLVEPINRSGSPVILTVEELITAHPDKTFILFNPDLEMKGSPVGIRERDRRQAVLDSFKSAYIYLSLATLSRPALIPRELGALHFQYEVGQFRLLRCLLPGDGGPGSLNRFFLGQKRVYETSAATPTKANPPKFYLVGEWEKRPGQEELSQAMEGAEAVLESRIKELTDSVTTEEEAKAILGEAARTRAVEPQKVLRSIAFLEKASRKGKKGPEEEERQAKELREKIGGEWRLVFTTGTKGTQAKVGNINYWPLGKAVQKFSQTSSDYSNNIYLGGFNAVQVIGSFSCPLRRRLEFVVESIKLGPFGFQSSGTGFFTFILVDDQIAVARGQGGGLALWAREA